MFNLSCSDTYKTKSEDDKTDNRIYFSREGFLHYGYDTGEYL